MPNNHIVCISSNNEFHRSSAECDALVSISPLVAGFLQYFLFTLAPLNGERLCNGTVSICLFVCLSVCPVDNR